MQLILAVFVLLFFFSSAVSAETGKWTETNEDSAFWTKEGARFIPKDNAKRQFQYSALRFDRSRYSYELLDLERLLDTAFPEKTKDGFVFDKSTGQYRAIQASVLQAWEAFQEDKSVVALVPMGFARTAGEPRIVGYRKIDGKLFRGLFSASNLDTILCLDDVGDPRKNRYPFQVPLIVGINFPNQKFTFNYLGDLAPINLSGKETKSSAEQIDYYKSRLDACPDAVQVGPRILQPRDYEPAENAPGRLAYSINSVASDKSTSRIVMLYDWNGWVNFVRTSGNSTLYDIGTLLSSDAFYDKEPGDPRKCKWGPLPPSLSCELWAVTVAAFDNAAVAIRKGDEVEFWGDPNRFTPGVLVIRKRPETNTISSQVEEDQIENQ